MLRPFAQDDFDELQSWFADATLEAALGPLDRAWLDAVLAENPPAEFCWLHQNRLVAVIGIARPTSPDQPWVITDLAVHPDERRRGHARAALDAVIEQESGHAVWRAYVMTENASAQRFFRRIGWIRRESDDEAMLCFDSR